MNLKSFLPAFFMAGLLGFSPFSIAQAQIKGDLKAGITPSELTLQLDTLPAFEGVDVPKPYRRLFLIFNDRQFYTADVAEAVFKQSHGFDGAILGSDTAKAMVFSKAIYSDEDDDPPPKIVSASGPTVAAAAPDRTKAVPDSALIAITPDHPALIPKGRTVLTVSVKNDSSNIATVGVPYSGYLLLFHESKLLIEASDRLKKRTDTFEKTAFPEKELDVYIVQKDMKSGLPSPLRSDGAEAIDLTVLNPGSTFKTLQLFRVSGLQPGAEQHFFLPVQNHNMYYKSIPEGGSGTARYAAVLLLEPGNFDPPQLSTEENEGISKLGLPQLLGEGIPVTVLEDTIDILNQEFQVMAYTSAEQKVRRSYDPNTITLSACPCPDPGVAAQKLLIKVAFENEGAGATGAVRVRVPLPEAMEVSSIPDELFSVSPGIETVELERDPSANTLTVTFPSLRLAGADEGKSMEARSGYFSFMVYTNPGTDVSALPPTQACIGFRDATAPDDLFNTEVCTPPGTVTFIEATEASDNAMALDCRDCKVDMGATGMTVLGMPLWLFLLLLVIIAGAILLAFYYDEWLG